VLVIGADCRTGVVNDGLVVAPTEARNVSAGIIRRAKKQQKWVNMVMQVFFDCRR